MVFGLQGDSAGFAPLTPEEKQRAKQYQKTATIAPGHLFLFEQTTVHEIVAKTVSHTSMRLFIGFRLTPSPAQGCLHDRMMASIKMPKGIKPVSLKDAITTGAILPLKSGQWPALYPKLTWSNKSIFRELTTASKTAQAEWGGVSLTDSLVPAAREWKRIKVPGDHDSEPTRQLIAPMYCPSLAAMDLPIPEYSPQDRAILYPHTHQIFFTDTHTGHL